MVTVDSNAEAEFDRAAFAATLKRLRKLRKWSQQKLAAEARIAERTVQRYENGEQVPEDQTLLKLAKALDVAPDGLLGRGAAEHLEEVRLGKQAFSRRLQIRNDCMNALALVARTYGISPAHIVEASPLLFDMAARGSLRRRQKKLDAVNDAIGTVESAAEDFPHLPPSSFTKCYEALDVEEASIARRDLFANDVDDAPIHNPGSGEYQYSTDNPLALHMREMAEMAGPEVEFRSWPPYDGPHYTICKEQALEFVGGDEEAATAILKGHAPINRMIKVIGVKASAAERATWVKAEAERFKVEWEQYFADFDLLLDQAMEETAKDGEGEE